MGTVVYVSGADRGEIHVLALDAERATLTLRQLLEPGGSVMPLAISPDRRRLYAARRSEPHAVLAFAIADGDGRLEPIGEAPLPASMAYLATDRQGRWLLAASYPSGLVSVSPIGATGVPGTATVVLPTGPKAHSIRASADNRFVYAAVLGADVVRIWRFDAASGSLEPAAVPEVAVRPGAGPRHFVFHPDLSFLYLLNELDASVDAFAVDAGSGALTHRQTVSGLPERFAGEPWAAEIRLTPDGRFLYVSERRASLIAGFAVDPVDGRLEPIGHWPTQAQPRGMAVDPSGRFLIVAGQLSHRAGLHRIAADGTLVAGAEVDVGLNPTWVEAVELP
jgi:6-phosphogluconolactonase